MMLHTERYLDALSSDMRGQLLTLAFIYFQQLKGYSPVKVTCSGRMKQSSAAS